MIHSQRDASFLRRPNAHTHARAHPIPEIEIPTVDSLLSPTQTLPAFYILFFSFSYSHFGFSTPLCCFVIFFLGSDDSSLHGKHSRWQSHSGRVGELAPTSFSSDNCSFATFSLVAHPVRHVGQVHLVSSLHRLKESNPSTEKPGNNFTSSVS